MFVLWLAQSKHNSVAKIKKKLLLPTKKARRIII
jgi:hypothetical protein